MSFINKVQRFDMHESQGSAASDTESSQGGEEEIVYTRDSNDGIKVSKESQR